VNYIKQLPGKVWTWLKDTLSKIASFALEGKAKATSAAKDIFDAIVDKLEELPGKLLEIGKNLVKGLWDGVLSMKDWVEGKIESFCNSFVEGFEDFFDINSPSRVFRDQIGKMLALGLAEGIEDNADKPLGAMADMAKDLLGEADSLNGLTLERRLQHTFAPPESLSGAESGMLDKLDKILSAIERGQILTIDGRTWVGATADETDSVLGQRRALVARGAI
jgi:phage-related protein